MNDILSTRCPGKRLTNELNYEWTEEKQEEINTYYHGTQNNIMTFFMFFENIKNPIEIHLKFKDSTYPFKPPQVLIGSSNYPYTSLLPYRWSFAQKIWGNKCPCCDTVICRGNWGPKNKISDITNEIRENFNKKIRIMNIFLCKKIVDKHFGHYLPIEEFL
tara:strand:+ start:143 stop:625 length:483 start_codon:yes stop_codon:yes gene_type:complete